MSNFTFTENESIIFNQLVNTFKSSAQRDSSVGSYSFFDGGLAAGWDSGTYADVMIDETGDPKVFRGVVSSLIKKGFLESNRSEDGVWLMLTEAAVEEITAAL